MLGLGRELSRGGSVVRAIRTTYQSDFSSDTDGWSKANDIGSATIQGGQTVGGESDCLKLTFGADATLVIRKTGIVDPAQDLGAQYDVSFSIYVEASGYTNPIEHVFGNFVNNNEDLIVGQTDAWVDVSFSATAAASWAGNALGLRFRNNDGWTAGDVVAIKNYKMVIYEV